MNNSEKVEKGKIAFRKYGWLINIVVKVVTKLPYRFRKYRFDALRYKRGKLGIALRFIYLKTLARSCGENVTVMQGVYILHPEKLSVGSNVSFNAMCYIECGFGEGVFIGDNVSLAHSVTLMAVNHGYEDPTTPIKYQEVVSGKISIEDNVWLGAKVTVLKDVLIQTGSIVGANAVVSKDIEQNTIVAGIPAKLLKRRY